MEEGGDKYPTQTQMATIYVGVGRSSNYGSNSTSPSNKSPTQQEMQMIMSFPCLGLLSLVSMKVQPLTKDIHQVRPLELHYSKVDLDSK